MIFDVEKVSGFYCAEPFFKIYKIKGLEVRPFFQRKGRPFPFFNLPSGIYKIDYPVKRLKKPFPFWYFVKLPPPEFSNFPKKLTLSFGSNPNKASINRNTGKILIDERFLDDDEKLKLLFFHEIGHVFYRKEENADKFAFWAMLKIGYNPKHIFEIAKETLSPAKSFYRILLNFDNAKILSDKFSYYGKSN